MEKEKRTERIYMKVLPSVKAAAEQRAAEEGRSVSNYIEGLIKKDIERNSKMEKYVYEIYRDKGGIGEQIIFDLQSEAIKYAKDEFAKLTEKEKAITDMCRVYKIEISAADLQTWEDGELDGILDDFWKSDTIDLLK